MQYFKVNAEAKGVQMGHGWQLIGRELVTEREAIKRKWDLDKLKINSTLVDIDPKKTYFFFGCRREKEKHIY